MTERAMEHWRLVTYDVWGGAPDDDDAEWTVNDMHLSDSLELPEEATDDEIVASVQPIFREDLRSRIEVDASVDGGDDTIYLRLTNGYPLCEIRRDR